MKIEFKHHFNIEQTMQFEEQYHLELRFDLDEKKKLLENAEGFKVWLLIDSELAGETYGIPFSRLHESIKGCKEYQHSVGIIYCYSNTILPKFQGKGFGSLLKAYWLGLCKGEGIIKVVGHARPNASQTLAEKFNAKMGATFCNWYNTGEDYKVYTITL